MKKTNRLLNNFNQKCIFVLITLLLSFFGNCQNSLPVFQDSFIEFKDSEIHSNWDIIPISNQFDHCDLFSEMKDNTNCHDFLKNSIYLSPKNSLQCSKLTFDIAKTTDVEVYIVFDSKQKAPEWLTLSRWEKRVDVLKDGNKSLSIYRKIYYAGSTCSIPYFDSKNNSLTFKVFAKPAMQLAPSGWDRLGYILDKIKEPQFAEAKFNVTDFGAKGDYKTNCYLSFKKAIEKCAKAGGGKVIVPAGNYVLNGPIHLKSNVCLHLERNATIHFRGEKKDYLVGKPEFKGCVRTRYESTECYHYSPLIYAFNEKNIAVTGEDSTSVIDGGQVLIKTKISRVGVPKEIADKRLCDGTKFVTWTTNSKHRSSLRDMADAGVPVENRIFGEGMDLRVPLIQFLYCENVLFDNFKIEYSPFWCILPCQSVNVIGRRLVIRSFNNNNDGFDPDGCRNVLIENCDFETGDDAICVKSGRDADGWRVALPSEDIVIRNNKLNSHTAEIALGSEMSAGIRNVFVYNNTQSSSGVFRVSFKSNYDRGGSIQDVYVKDSEVTAVYAGFTNYGYRGGNKPSYYDNITLDNLPLLKTATFGNKERSMVNNVFIQNCPQAVISFKNDTSQPTPEPEKKALLTDSILKY